MTGWGQDGPLAQAAGHDINYIALAGNLHGYGRADGPPTPPVNAVGDFGGGGMLLAFAMLAGILSARATGKGSVIDCAMVDGAALLAAQTWTLARRRHVEGRARRQPARFRRRLLRQLPMRRRPVGLGRRARAAILRRAQGEARPGVGAVRSRPARRAGRALPHAAARPLVRLARRHRRLLRAGPVAGRGAGPSAQCRRARTFTDRDGSYQPHPAPRFKEF